MNINTGEIRELKEGDKPSQDEILIEMKELTLDQKKNMKVDLKDKKSVAGKKLQKARNQLTLKQKRNKRRNLRKRIKKIKR